MGGRIVAESGKEYLIHFEPENCTQCHGCEIACKTWRELGYGIRYRRVLNLWEGEYPRIKSASLSLACLHCVAPACVAACPEGAIAKRADDGLVLVNETLCAGCETCAEACPFGVPQFKENGTMQKCDACNDQPLAGAAPPCVDTCPGKALSLIEIGPSEKLAHEKRIRQLLKSR
jgi:anaerobic dimethyl sulfoxide reductase subunit B (iron-sulfur subunit)